MNVPKLSKWLALSSLVPWTLAWVALWASAEWGRAGWIFEPAAVGLSLGLTAMLWFAAIYFREDVASEPSHRLRSAIAGSVVLVFLLLVIDLLTIAGLRDSLKELNEGAGSGTGGAASADDALSFVEGLLGTFRWVVITVVGFYFAAGAAEAVGKNVEEAKKAGAEAEKATAEAAKVRAQADVEVAKAAARG
jgi:hypothetical protein